MISFKDRIKLFSQNAQKEEKKDKDNQNKPKPGKLFQNNEFLKNINANKKKEESNNINNENKKPIISNTLSKKNKEFLDLLNKGKANEKKQENDKSENQEIKIQTGSIQDKIKNLLGNENTQNKNTSTNNEIKKNDGFKNLINKFSDIKPKTEQKIIKNEEKPKIMENSEIITNENPDMIIYKYPNQKFSQRLINNSKKLLFIGKNPVKFLNAFINIYSDINYEDKFRYKIDDTNLNNHNKDIYFIKARTAKNNLVVMSIKTSCQSGELVKDALNELNINEIIQKKINYIFFTLEEDEQLVGDEPTIFLTLLNLFKKENIQNKFMILYSSNNLNNILINEEYIKKNVIFNEYTKMPFSSILNPEYFSINHKTIFDKSSSEISNEYKKMEEEMKKIQNKISFSKTAIVDDIKASLYKDIFSSEEKINQNVIKYFGKASKEEQIVFLNSLLMGKVNVSISAYILFLYNKIIENKKEIKIIDEIINFVKNEKLNNTIYIFSKIKFKKVRYLNCENCDLNDNSLYMIKNLFSNSSVEINLSKNQFTDMTVFDKVEYLTNLQVLDLSYNKINKIEGIFSCNFSELKKLNLSHNEISDISCLQNDLKCNKLNHLDLSYNKIKKMNKINIGNLSDLILLKNEITEGVLDFLNSLDYNKINKVIMEKTNNELLYKFHNLEEYETDTLSIKLTYLVENNNNINEVFKTVCFKSIYYLEIHGFDNIDFLSNESLIELKTLDFKSEVNDISIFNDIKFTNIQKINFTSHEKISKGFSSLKIFKNLLITTIKIDKINNDYLCNLYCKNPEFHCIFIFTDLNFLKEEFLANTLCIEIPQDILIDKNNADFFSYEEIKNSFPIFSKLKAQNVDIIYNDNKYECSIKFFTQYWKMNFTLNDLNFIFDDMFHIVQEISFSNLRLNSNIGLSREKFPDLRLLNLKNNIIESTDFFTELKKLNLNIHSTSNLCKSELFEFLDNEEFKIDKIISNEKKQIEIHYLFPFDFHICVDNINKIKTMKMFRTCKEISLNNLELTDEDIKFLKNEKFSLNYINLNYNKITNLNILEYFKSYNVIQIKNNEITTGIETVNNDPSKILTSFEVKLKNEDQNFHIISMRYLKNYSELIFDYLYSVNNNLDILKIFNFENIKNLDLNLSCIKLKNIDFLQNKNMGPLRSIILDNNLIEDISILTTEKISCYPGLISLKGNPIRQGTHVLNMDYFNCVYINLDINKMENEYIIYSSFNYPSKIKIDFYIKDVNEIKNILDIKNTYIKLLKNDTNELKTLESELLTNQSQEQKEIFELIISLLNTLEKRKKINIIKENNKLEIIEEKLYFNDNNKNILEKTLSYLHSKLKNYYFEILQLNLTNLGPESETLIQYLSFLNVVNLKIKNCNFNLNNLKYLYRKTIKKIDLSETSVTDIKDLCENDQLENLEVLNLSNNPDISNLYMLKDAKFRNLKELNLSNNDLDDLNKIQMGDYHFDQLSVLTLCDNQIEDLNPVLKAFKGLNVLNLDNNKLNRETELSYILEKNPIRRVSLIGNAISESNFGIYYK